jgi:pimeloyl-ACP methyl ester carboxylesterase
VLVLHGFLQTYHFSTVQSIVTGLHAAGYTTLAPTLTLAVPYRDQPLACEAIHTHTLDDDEAEIGSWLHWLEGRHPGPVILIGHSTGSMELLAYASRHRDPRVRKLIGVSIIEAKLMAGEPARARLTADLERRVRNRDITPVTHEFSFCDHYTATPASLLSYLQWSPSRILGAARALPIPATFVMGTGDSRIAPDWIVELRKTGKKVRLIKGASHFLDGLHEFDLLDAIYDEARL